MIVQPNFLDHWKTRMLQAELSDDPLAPTYILRLWGHCQEQKTHRFPKLSAPALAAICCFKTSPEQLWLAMQTAQFIIVKGTTVEVHQWNDYNSGLIRSWENGKKGGRPKKTQEKPRETHGLRRVNLDVTDRVDKIDKIECVGNGTHSTTDDQWLTELQRTNPAIDVRSELSACRKKFERAGREFFENSWLPNCERPLAISNGNPWDHEPDGWRAYWRGKYPPEDYPDAVRHDESGAWSELTSIDRKFIWQGMKTG